MERFGQYWGHAIFPIDTSRYKEFSRTNFFNESQTILMPFAVKTARCAIEISDGFVSNGLSTSKNAKTRPIYHLHFIFVSVVRFSVLPGYFYNLFWCLTSRFSCVFDTL